MADAAEAEDSQKTQCVQQQFTDDKTLGMRTHVRLPDDLAPIKRPGTLSHKQLHNDVASSSDRPENAKNSHTVHDRHCNERDGVEHVSRITSICQQTSVETVGRGVVHGPMTWLQNDLASQTKHIHP